MSYKSLILVFLSVVMSPDLGALAEVPSNCAAIAKEVTYSSALGSAGTWVNLRNAAGSLRYETSQMLSVALAKAKNTSPPADLCPPDCKLPQKPLVIFSAVPHKLLDKYSDRTECEKLLKQTSTVPFRYQGHNFDNSEDLASWFNEFSQGKGDDGKDLYRKCDGSCSPRYSTQITLDNSNYHTNTDVICGHARDKSDDQYDLSIKYLWRCEN